MLVTRDLIGGRLFTVLYLQIIFLLKSSARDPFSFDPDPGYSVKGDGGDGTFDVGGGGLPSFLVQIFQFFGCTPN